ncbi:MAG TPA: hypothetical protein VHT50_31810 [Mycobacterium sp.]|nr:hypothetical protein [Mycobacterium sp.]
MRFEPERCSHVAVANGKVLIAIVIATSTGYEGSGSQQHEVTVGGIMKLGDRRQAVQRGTGLGEVSFGAVLQQAFHENLCAPRAETEQFDVVHAVEASTKHRYCTGVASPHQFFGQTQIEDRQHHRVVPTVD